MSDFDKEAERERLREKYERDQQKREATEQMSELLLKGATMTNAHCENCGDPIFRYDGEEFCPTCQQVVAGADDAGDSGEQSPTAAAGDPETTAATDTEQSADAAAADAADESAGPPETDVSATADDPSSLEMKRPTGTAVGGVADSNGDGPAGEQAGESAADASQPEPASDATQSGATPSSGATGGQAASPSASRPADGTAGAASDALGEARASLTRALVSQAREAENCEDPRRARDHLAAAREAAEALSALSY